MSMSTSTNTPITEFASLSLLPPHTIRSPAVHSFLRDVSSRQSACSKYPLQFYATENSDTELHLISGWRDVAAHEEWIASEENQRLLKEYGEMITVTGLVHLDANFQRFLDQKADILVCYVGDAEEHRLREEGTIDIGMKGSLVLEGRDLDPAKENAMYEFWGAPPRHESRAVKYDQQLREGRGMKEDEECSVVMKRIRVEVELV